MVILCSILCDPGDPQIMYGGTYDKKLPKGGVVNFGKFENYFGTFGFEFLCPGSFYKILKNTFDFFFIAQPSLKF